MAMQNEENVRFLVLLASVTAALSEDLEIRRVPMPVRLPESSWQWRGGSGEQEERRERERAAKSEG
jgi:hypothetical protein